MKKILAYLLTVAMLLSMGIAAFATGENLPAADAEQEEETPVIEPDPELVRTLGYNAARAIAYGVNADDIVYYDHVTVGNTTPMRGDFFTELWTNSTSDMDVRNLLHGYNLVRWDGENGSFRSEPTVVTGMIGTENVATGDRTYTMVLANDLYYSDGSRITAWDYAFSYLLRLSPAIQEIGGAPAHGSAILGAEAYMNGTTNVLEGVRVTADNQIEVTLDGEYLPYFFELGLLSCNPYPISVIAPGCSVQDDGEGVYLRGNFNAALLESTINGAGGYRRNPSVVSGPYRLVSFDGTTAEFERNDYYKGNADLELPLIEKLTYTLADNASMEQQLLSGEFDILNKVTRADVITAGMGEIAEGQIAMSNYPRSGLAYVVFCCEKDTVSSEAVRQAMAWCMDRDAITADYTGNFGLKVDSYFGVGQWMYALVNGTTAPPVDPPEDENDPEQVAEYEAELEAWRELSLDGLNTYTVENEESAAAGSTSSTADAVPLPHEGKAVNAEAVAEAVRLLESDQWLVDSDSGIRHKVIGGEDVYLDFVMLVPAGNAIAESFEKNWIPNLEAAGIKLTMRTVAPNEITATAYADGDRDADMFFMATNFDIMFDPATSFEVGGERSMTRQTDAELYDLAVDMRETEPGEVLEYVQKWLAFEEKFNEALPMIPIYSNVYFDFYTAMMQNYDIAENTTWSEAILGAVKADIPEYEIPGAEGEEDEIEDFG